MRKVKQERIEIQILQIQTYLKLSLKDSPSPHSREALSMAIALDAIASLLLEFKK